MIFEIHLMHYTQALEVLKRQLLCGPNHFATGVLWMVFLFWQSMHSTDMILGGGGHTASITLHNCAETFALFCPIYVCTRNLPIVGATYHEIPANANPIHLD
jgi:hypothetical protein